MKGTEYTVDNATIIQDTDSDGSQVNDADGLGAAVIAYGSGTKLTISNSYIETTGAGKSALYIGGGADVIVKNSTLIANSGTLYDTYMSSANTSGMLSSPWILGVDNARGNARTVSMVGAGSTETFVDSTVIAAGWGAMSTDMGSYLRMDVINTTVEAETGYAAFAISRIQETYYGSTLTSGVIGMIMMGGQADFTSYTGGEVITIKRMEASGEGKDSYYGAETDEVITEVVSEQVAEGETVTSSITTDGVGFEMHTMMGSDAVNGVTLRDGTSLETGEAAFVVKSGFGEVTVDDATITLNASKYTGETVFLQVMDNDDAFAGESAGTSFDEYFWEPAGWSFQFGTLDQDEWEDGQYDTMDYGTEGGSNYGQWTVTVDLTDTDIEGDMWNSSGYWNQGASLMQVSIGEGATVTGVISSGAYQHYAKTYEVGLYGYYEATGVDLEDNTWYNTYSGTWDNVDYISIVVNTPYYYGANGTEITITDGGVWNVTDTSFVTALSVDGGEINGVAGIYKVTVTVEDMDNQAGTVTVASCEQVEWDGGDINIAAEDNTTLYVIVPEGSDIDDIIVVGESLGYAAEEYEGQYFGSFYVVGEGVLETPLDY
ncbi:MAG: hypothetical protein LUG57_00515 [Oscillospiraceae bacterium]|nr:hypothetical protein [Oscillospiraceae bacterium]